MRQRPTTVPTRLRRERHNFQRTTNEIHRTRPRSVQPFGKGHQRNELRLPSRRPSRHRRVDDKQFTRRRRLRYRADLRHRPQSTCSKN